MLYTLMHPKWRSESPWYVPCDGNRFRRLVTKVRIAAEDGSFLRRRPGAAPAKTRRRPGVDSATDPDCLVHIRMKEISFNHAWNSREESSVLNETQKSEDELKIGSLVIEEEPM